MSYCKTKTRFLAELSIERFLLAHPRVWFWTFTEPGRKDGEVRWSKTDAEIHLKPFLDLMRRRQIEHLVVWELQKRGSWHPHILLNKYFDVNWLRPWMMARGWGQQMRAECVDMQKRQDGAVERLLTYVTKSLQRYLLKAKTDDEVEPRKKFFGGSQKAKAGNVKFSWNPATDTAHAMLYYYGRNLFVDIFGASPSFRDLPIIMRLGVEDRDWLDVDFLYAPPFS